MDLQILDLIKKTIRGIEPRAEIILYGSRARGTNRPDSDWDILVLIDTVALNDDQKGIDYILWDKGIDFGQEINTLVRTKSYWDSNPSLFKHNVTLDAIYCNYSADAPM